MKLQDKAIVLDQKQQLSAVKQVYRAGFSSNAGFAVKDRVFVYACGKNVVLDYFDSNTQVQLIAHDAAASCTCVAGNGLIASGQLASPGNKNYDSPIFLWKIGNHEPIGRFLGLKEGVKRVLFSQDCRYLAGVSHKDQLMVWDIKTQSQILTKNFENPILILNFSNQSIILVIGKGIYSLSLTPLLGQNKPPIITNFTLPNTGLPRIYSCLVSLGNDTFVIGTQSGQICVFAKGIFKSGAVAGKGKVYSLVFSNGKEILASVGNELVRFDIIGQQLKQKDRKPVQQINALSSNQKGQTYSMSSNSIAKVSPDLKLQQIKFSHSSKINHSQCKNNTIVSIDELGTLICRYFKGSEISLTNVWRYPQPKIPGRCVEVHQNGILAGFNDGKLLNLNHECSKVQWQINAHKGPLTTIYSSQACLLTGGQDCVVRIWSKNRQLINQISAHQKPVSKVLGDAISSHLLHSCSLDRSIQTYDLKVDKKLYFRQAQGGNLTDMIQDQKTGELITCGNGSAVSFWKPQDHQPYKNLINDNGHAIKLALSPNSNLLALGCDNGLVCLFNTKNNNHLGFFRAHSGPITGISWINQSNFLTSGQDYCLAIWSYQ